MIHNTTHRALEIQHEVCIGCSHDIKVCPTPFPLFIRKVGSNSKTLTKRQFEVLKYLGEGCSNKEIAHLLNVSEATIKLHINSLLRIMHVKNRTQAVLI